MEEFIKLREEELKAELEKVAVQVGELQATAQRIQGALILLAEMKAKLEEKP